MNGEYKIGETVRGTWTLVKLLGEGAYGKVYEAHREDFGTTYKAAVKIMSIPQSQSEVESARAEGYDDDSVTAYFRSFVEEVVQEFALMSRLKGMTNIVSYEDHSVTERTEGIGWDILIRMELLTPMLKYMSSHRMTRSDVIKLGIDICKALELCQKYNIIHRDIKPENIFISETGDYKLGDFGVARTLEKTTGGLSKKGTYTYMAPEIYKDEKYGSSVDIYSLGIVLYRLLNNNRAPFLPEPPKPITHSERERGLVRRISGEPLPPPANADGRLAEIVLMSRRTATRAPCRCGRSWKRSSITAPRTRRSTGRSDISTWTAAPTPKTAATTRTRRRSMSGGTARPSRTKRPGPTTRRPYTRKSGAKNRMPSKQPRSLPPGRKPDGSP